VSGLIEVGQVWRHEAGEGLVRVIAVSADSVLFRGEECCELEPDDFRRYYYPEPGPTKPTIKLRIRVGVTASGAWVAIGEGGRPARMNVPYVVEYHLDPQPRDPIVAWHWITAEVPMPDVEQGEVAGEVER